MAFCTRCGAQLPEGANYCHSCGAPAVAQATKRSTNQVFKVGASPRIVVNNRAAGSIDVSPSTTNDQVSLELRLKEPEYIDWNASQDGDLVTVGCRLKRGVLELPGGFSLQGARADVIMKVPNKVTMTLSNRFGEITIFGIEGNDLNAESQAGSISVRNFAGTTRVSTKTGLVTLENVNGRVDVRNIAGSINYSGDPGSGDGSLTTRVGNIDAALSGDLNVQIDAITRVGHVSTDPSLKTSDYHSEQYVLGNRIRFQLGAGTKRLYLETTTGTISIRSEAPHS
jgi:Putative adhesin/zinc-ribbon domain